MHNYIDQTANMSISRLIFYPAPGTQTVEASELLEVLTDAGFIQQKMFSHNHYLPGEQFLSLLTFMGCSPHINIAPLEGEHHCYFSLIQQTIEPECLGYTRTANPKCPHCKKRIANWKTDTWQTPNQLCSCDKCQNQTLYSELNWKQECGFARCGFEIAHIYPHEVVPSDKLLDILQSFSGLPWQYCYANN